MLNSESAYIMTFQYQYYNKKKLVQTLAREASFRISDPPIMCAEEM